MSFALSKAGRLAEARALQIEALATKRNALGDRHPSTFESAAQLGEIEFKLGNFAAAKKGLIEALHLAAASSIEPDVMLLKIMDVLSKTLRAAGEDDAADLMEKRFEKTRSELMEQATG